MSNHIDVGSAPIERIFAETPLFPHPLFHAVTDRDPIVPGHILVVAKESAGSFADVSGRAALGALLEAAADCKPCLFYERGRARFCTSGLTSMHAHGHILPLCAFRPGTLESLVDAVQAERVDSIDAALTSARSRDVEYLLLADDRDCFLSLPSPLNRADKRFVRNFLLSCRAHG